MHQANPPAIRGSPDLSDTFEGRKLVVVGGSSGMGKETAADVVAGGGSAVIIGREQARVDETVAELGKQGQAWGITADLADRSQVEAAQAQLAAEHADATLLVNAAGFFIPKPFLEYDGAFYDADLELDRAIFFLTQTVVRGISAAGGDGAIVNVGSMWAHQAIAATPSSGYSVAKAGLHALTKNLAIELAPRIRVNAVAPAVVKTPLYGGLSPRTRSIKSWPGSTPCTRSGARVPPATSPPLSPSCSPLRPAG